MKRILLLIILNALSINCWAFDYGDDVFIEVVTVGGYDYTDNFDDNDITDWAQASGTWAASSGVLSASTAAGHIVAPTDLSNTDQYAAVKMSAVESTNCYEGLSFNIDSTAQTSYAVRWEEAGQRWLFRKISSWTSGNGDIGAVVSGSLSNGDSYGIRSSTISTVKVIRLYYWSAQSPPTWGTWADGACVKAWCNGTCPGAVVCTSEEDVSSDGDWALLSGTKVGYYKGGGSPASTTMDDYTYGVDD